MRPEMYSFRFTDMEGQQQPSAAKPPSLCPRTRKLRVPWWPCVVIASLLVGPDTGEAGRQESEGIARRAGNQLAERLATGNLGGNFAPSLQSKEFADFLLTPALLMQEVICEDSIITYPSE